MKLYIYDEKHEKINEKLDFDNISQDQLDILINTVIFLNEKLTTRYNRLVLADSYTICYDEENDTSELYFKNRVDV